MNSSNNSLLSLKLAWLCVLLFANVVNASAWQVKYVPLMTPWTALVDTDKPLPSRDPLLSASSDLASLCDPSVNNQPSMALRITTSTKLFLDKAITVESFLIGGHTISPRTYTPMQLAVLADGGTGALNIIPAAPTGLSASVTHGNQVTLTWNPSPGVASYNIYIGTNSGGETLAYNDSTSPGTSIVTGLTNRTTYYFEVTGVNASGESAVSSEVSATPLEAPTSLSATATNGQVTLSWQPVAGATSYNIYIGMSRGNETYAYNDTTVSNGSTVTALANGMAYYFEVTAANASGESAISSEVNATPLATPTDLHAQPGNGQVTLSWRPIIGATGYNILIGTRSGGETNAYIDHTSLDSSTVTNLANGTRYYFELIALNTNGESAVSSEVSATPAR